MTTRTQHNKHFATNKNTPSGLILSSPIQSPNSHPLGTLTATNCIQMLLVVWRGASELHNCALELEDRTKCLVEYRAAASKHLDISQHNPNDLAIGQIRDLRRKLHLDCHHQQTDNAVVNKKRRSSTLDLTLALQPSRYTDLLSSENQNQALAKWLKDFGDSDRKNEINAYPLALISGPSGSGKTTLAQIAAAKSGYNILNIIGSENSSLEKLKSVLQEALRTSSLLDFKTKENQSARKRCIIIDESDCLQKNALQYLQKINNSANSGKAPNNSSKFPVILVCNNAHSSAMYSIRKNCLHLPLKRPTKEQMTHRILTKLKSHKIHSYSTLDVLKLCDKLHRDIRTIINAINFAHATTSDLRLENLSHFSPVLQGFEALDTVFMSKPGDLISLSNFVKKIDSNVSQNNLVQLVYANMLHFCNDSPLKSNSKLPKILEYFQVNGQVENFTNSYQNYSLYSFPKFLIYYCHVSLRSTKNRDEFYKYSQGKSSEIKKCYDSRVEIINGLQRSIRNKGNFSPIIDVWDLFTTNLSLIVSILNPKFSTLNKYLMNSEENKRFNTILQIYHQFDFDFMPIVEPIRPESQNEVSRIPKLLLNKPVEKLFFDDEECKKYYSPYKSLPSTIKQSLSQDLIYLRMGKSRQDIIESADTNSFKRNILDCTSDTAKSKQYNEEVRGSKKMKLSTRSNLAFPGYTFKFFDGCTDAVKRYAKIDEF